MERNDLADFLRRRRALLQPENVGVPGGGRRRTPGLRRFEVAQLAGMSPDYYARLEQGRGPQPSVTMLTALARALRLTIDERDHLFRLAGHHAPPRIGGDEHVSRGLLRLLDGLRGLPALVASDLNIVLAQNPMADALVGEQTHFRGLARSCTYRYGLPTKCSRDASRWLCSAPNQSWSKRRSQIKQPCAERNLAAILGRQTS